MNWFLVRLKLSGVSEVEALKDISDLQAELNMRTYLRNPKVWWESKAQSILVEIEIEGVDAKRAGLAVYDDFFESAVATINFSSEEGFRIEIVEVSEGA
jgi:hypothetical protein